jgi:septal ring factor EnvC (AmiA/AmiB activator)
MQRRRNDAEADGETGGIDFPQGLHDDSSVKAKAGKSRSRKVRSATQQDQEGKGFMLKFSFLMTIVLVASYFLIAHHEEMQLEHLRQNIIHDELEPLSREWEEKYAKLEDENAELKRGAKAYANLKEESDRLKEEYSKQQRAREKLDKQIEQLQKYKGNMQDNIKLMSKTALVEK